MPLFNICKWIKVRGVTVTTPLFLFPYSGNTVTAKTVTFESPPEWESGNFFAASEPTRVKVPAGFDGRYLVRAVVHWSDVLDGIFTPTTREGSYLYIRVIKNGAETEETREARSTAAPIAGASRTTQDSLWETNLSSGDYLELTASWIVKDSSVTDENTGLKLEAWLTLRRLGKPA